MLALRMNSMVVSTSSMMSKTRHSSENFTTVLTDDIPGDPTLNFETEATTHTGLSTFHTIVSVIKCAVGAGSFTLPRSFYSCGLVSSCALTLLMGSISCCTLCMVLQSDDSLQNCNYLWSPRCHANSFIESGDNIESVESRQATPNASKEIKYTDLGTMAFPTCTMKCFGSSKNVVEQILFFGILMTSLGVCAAYVDFIAGTLPEVLGPWFGWTPSREIVTFVCLPVILFLAYLPDFKSLVWTSVLGDMAVLSGCVAVVAYGAMHSGPAPLQALPWKHAVVNTDMSAVAEFIGSAGFLFAIHVAVFPIFQQMKGTHGDQRAQASPSERETDTERGGSDSAESKGRSRINDMKYCAKVSFGVLTVFNIVFGCVGGLLYAHMDCEGPDQTGASTSARHNGPCTNVLSNIRSGPVLGLVKALICVDLLFTIPLVLTAGREIVEAVVLDLLFGPDQGQERQTATEGKRGGRRGGRGCGHGDQVSAAQSSSSPWSMEMVTHPHHAGDTNGGDERGVAVLSPLVDQALGGSFGCSNELSNGNDDDDDDDDEREREREAMGVDGTIGMKPPNMVTSIWSAVSVEDDEEKCGEQRQPPEGVEGRWAREGGVHDDQYVSVSSSVTSSPAPNTNCATHAINNNNSNDGDHEAPEANPKVTPWRALCCCGAQGAVRYAVRSVLVLVVIGVALGIPHFGDMVDLIGGTMGPVLCYLIPAAIHLRARAWEGAGPLSLWGAALHGGIVAFGLLTLLVSTYFTLLSMMRR